MKLQQVFGVALRQVAHTEINNHIARAFSSGE